MPSLTDLGHIVVILLHMELLGSLGLTTHPCRMRLLRWSLLLRDLGLQGFVKDFDQVNLLFFDILLECVAHEVNVLSLLLLFVNL